MKKFTLRSKILLVFILLFSIPILASIIVFRIYATGFFEDSTKLLNISNMKYVGSGVNQVFKTVYDFSLYTITEKNINQYLSSNERQINYNAVKNEAQEVLALLPFSNEYIKSICVFNNSGDYVSSGREYYSLLDDEKQILDSLKGFHHWTVTRDSSGEVKLFFSRKIRDLHNLKSGLGYLKIEVNIKSLINIFSNIESEGNYYYNLMDGNNNLIFSYSNNSTIGDFPTQNISLEDLNESLNTTFVLDNFHITPYKIPTIGWYVYSVSKNEYTQSMQKALLHILILSAVLCFIVCFLLAIYFSQRIAYPLKKLGSLMGSISNEDFSVRFKTRYSDEITVLANQFNTMSQKLDTLYNEVYLSNIKLRDAELAELQAKINPHFLYNTLDTIYWMSQMHDSADVSKMISTLSKLFRLTLSGGKDNIVPLALELEHLKCYLYIQQVRYGGNLKYTIANSEDQNSTMVMKLVMQPIVENAILHGIDTVGNGEIDILIQAEGTKLIYRISDTAGCADAEKINALLDTNKQRGGMGIKNINDRIKLKFSDEYGIACEVANGKTVFTITQPLTKLAEETESC